MFECVFGGAIVLLLQSDPFDVGDRLGVNFKYNIFTLKILPNEQILTLITAAYHKVTIWHGFRPQDLRSNYFQRF